MKSFRELKSSLQAQRSEPESLPASKTCAIVQNLRDFALYEFPLSAVESDQDEKGHRALEPRDSSQDQSRKDISCRQLGFYACQGQLATVTDAKNCTAAFYYDRAGRLVAEVAPNNYDSGKTLSQMSRTEYTYDAMDRIKTKGYTYLDPATQQWVSFIAKAYKYDGNGNKLKELDALGYEAGSGSVDEKINTGYGTEYTYDLANNITSVLDPVNKDRSLSFTTQYQYDGAGRKITETNAKDIDTVYTYDDADNILTISVDGHIIQENTYDLTGNLLTQTDGNDNTVTYEYNAFNKLKKAQYPGDTTIAASNITYQYDTNGNMKKSVNSAGPVDIYTYDNQGRQLSHTQEKADATQSITTSVRYDKAGNQRFVTDGNGVTRENIYNEVNKLVESKITVTNVNNVSADQSTYYGYDASGNQVTQTDWLGNIYTSVYDPLNRLIEKKDPLNKSIEKLEYNHNSVQIKSYDALNKLTQFTYDKNNRRLSTIDPLNHTKSQTYDEVGNVKTATDGLNNVTTYNYDEFNRLSSVVNAKNETTSYTYDLNGNMLTQTDGTGHVTTFEYNAANKVIRKIDHGGRTGTAPNYTYDAAKTESYTYNADGTLAIKTDRNGGTTSYTFDVHGWKLSEEAGSITITYTYDGNGNQLTMTDGTGTTTRTYDQLNRTKSKAVPGAGTLTFLYDVTTGLPAGQVKEIDTDPRSNVTAQVFDKAGRIIQVIADGNTTGYAYYDNGAKQSVTLPSGAIEEYAYYNDGMLYTLVNKKADQTVIDVYTYTYDAAHNMTSKVDAVGTTSYTYDDLNRLQTVTEPSTKVTTYTFDAAGNRATQTVTLGADSEVTTYTCNEQNRLTGAEVKLNNVTTKSVLYTYDNNGNQTLITTTPYVNGIPQTPEISVCTYDELNQLTTTEMPNGDIINNTYAGDGFRVAKQVNGTTTKYIYIGDKVLLELDGAGNQIAKNVQGTTMISRTVGGTTLYYMFNGHADVTALIDAMDAVQATYYYDAFGNIISSTGSANNPYTYAGYQYDEETGYYYLQSRFYDPITARFLSEDTYRGDPNDPLSLNLYTYCHNEPLMYSDPNGHWSLLGAISSAASYVSSAAKAVTSAVTSTSIYKAASSVVSSAVKKVTSTTTYQKAASAASPVKAKAVSVAKNAVTQVKEKAKQISAPPMPKVTKTASVVKTTSTTTSSSLATTSSSSKSAGSSRSSSKTSTSSKNTSKAAAKNSTKGTSKDGLANSILQAGKNLASKPVDTALATGGVILGTVGLVGSTVTEAGSLGTSSPVSVPIALFSANAVISSSADLKNIASGNFDHIGKVNPLKSAAEVSSKAAGEKVESSLNKFGIENQIGEYGEQFGEYAFEAADFYLGARGVAKGVQKIVDSSYTFKNVRTPVCNIIVPVQNVSNAEKFGAGLDITNTLAGWGNKAYNYFETK